MSFVIDASVAGAWLLPDEESESSADLMARLADEDALAPDLLRHEIRNIMLSAERRGRSDGDLVHVALARFSALPIELVSQDGDAEVVRVARHYRLSAYDAAYLALALLKNTPLATFDRKLADAARAEGVAVLGPFAKDA